MKRLRWFFALGASVAGALAACNDLVEVGPGAPTPDPPGDASADPETVAPAAGVDSATPVSCATFFDASAVPGTDTPRCLDFDHPETFDAGSSASSTYGFDDIHQAIGGANSGLNESPIPGGANAFWIKGLSQADVVGVLDVSPAGERGATMEADIVIHQQTNESSELAGFRFESPATAPDGGACRWYATLAARKGSDPGSTNLGITNGAVEITQKNDVPIHVKVRVSPFRLDAPVPSSSGIRFDISIDGKTLSAGHPAPSECFPFRIFVEVGSRRGGTGYLDARFDHVTYKNE